ncbi:hypothetical protein GALMADRAFT_242419 [Galerina marginata CBS 339.88]|uniref:CENP-V/GFA domain-containing protein n=1 Tax=Galerina marginata (strain CBS 339.88) TaxID=685588 RepID=A0A067TMG6_GALM3|nr:hypothetical protein GALMADRAFT_242419 [Galerina marginata CBS 339.88]
MTTYVNGGCHCDLNTFRVAFDTASLPISEYLCHCNTCRHSSGQLAVHQVSISGVPLTRIPKSSSRSPSPSPRGSEYGYHDESGHRNGGGNRNGHGAALLAPPSIQITYPEIPFHLGDLTSYRTSPDVTRYFCTSCSAHLFCVDHIAPGEDAWAVAAGALERTEGIVKIGYHIWVGDTLDGGLAEQLRAIDGVQLTRYKESKGSEELPVGWVAQSILDLRKGGAETGSANEEQLQAHCHCGAVTFAITRPSDASREPTSAYPDLLCPYDVSHLSKIANSQDEKWWLRPPHSVTPTKYLAGHCMCRSCRLNSGFEVQSWAYIPLGNIVAPHTDVPICLEDESQRPSGLKQYISSPGKYREFCGTCGASAFWWQAGVPDLVSVSVGLFDENNDGARAERWLEWHKARVSFQEKALSRGMAKGLEDGLKLT